MDCTKPLKVRCGIWHQDDGNRSFRSCKLWAGAPMDWWQCHVWSCLILLDLVIENLKWTAYKDIPDNYEFSPFWQQFGGRPTYECDGQISIYFRPYNAYAYFSNSYLQCFFLLLFLTIKSYLKIKFKKFSWKKKWSLTFILFHQVSRREKCQVKAPWCWLTDYDRGLCRLWSSLLHPGPYHLIDNFHSNITGSRHFVGSFFFLTFQMFSLPAGIMQSYNTEWQLSVEFFPPDWFGVRHFREQKRLDMFAVD